MQHLMFSRLALSLKYGFVILTLLLSVQAVSQTSAATLQSTEVKLINRHTQQPLQVRFWYQKANAACSETLCLTPVQDPSKIAVISHGAFGSPLEMNWLGYALASQGWLVAGIAHYGESWVYGRETIDPASVMRFWQRPQEVSLVIDHLSDRTLSNLTLQTNNVVMLGHSSGGFTALSLAGAKLTAGKAQAYCRSKQASRDKSCRYTAQQSELPLTDEQLTELHQLQQQMQDERVSAVIALDPALGHAVDERSLNDIQLPTLIIGSVDNDFLPYQQHARHYAEHIRHAQLKGIHQGAGHFIYINKCDHAHKAQGVALCKDRAGVDRELLQRQVLGEIFGFLARQGYSS